MKLSRQQILLASKISTLDADIRLEEYEKYGNLEPNKKNYDLNRIHAIFPGANYFDIKNTEGLYGQIDDYLFITFRGSDSLLDWIMDIIFCLRVIPYKGTNKKIKVHTGFLKSYKVARDFIHHVIKTTECKKIVLFGHSLGATISALAALDIQYNFPDKEIGCFVIGMPKLGNKTFKASFEKRLPDFIRVDHGSDLVPQFPPKCFGYAELENFFHIGLARKKGIGNMKDHKWHLYDDALNQEIDKIII